jgi:hypothetical protein
MLGVIRKPIGRIWTFFTLLSAHKLPIVCHLMSRNGYLGIEEGQKLGGFERSGVTFIWWIMQTFLTVMGYRGSSSPCLVVH